MRGVFEMLATVLAGVAILAVAVYLMLGDGPAPLAPQPPPQQASPAAAPAAVPGRPAAGVAPASRHVVPVDPASAAPRPGAPAGVEAPEGYVAVEDVLAPARDVGGGFVTGGPPLAVGPIVRLQKAPEVRAAAAAPEPVKARRFFRVVVEDAGTIRAGGRTLRLADVDVPAADAECGDAAGHEWSCGTRARTALRRFVRHRALDCRALDEAGFTGEAAFTVVRCSVGRTDLATWLVENGWAAPADAASPDLASLGAAAREGSRGLWQIEPKGLDDDDGVVEAADAADDPAEAAPGQ